MDKNELKTGDIITLRNGDRLIYNNSNEEFEDLNEKNDNNICDLYDLNTDMTYSEDTNENDVIKVERPKTYETIFIRKPKKMTVAEICKELGYDVEIIKEEN